MRMRGVVLGACALAAAGFTVWLSADWRGGSSSASEAARRPALRGTYCRGEGAAVEVEVEHGLPRLPPGPYPASILRAGERGADAKVTLRVVDPDGRPVPGAHVSGCFYNNGHEGRAAEGDTDAQGEFVLSGRCSGDLNFRVDKAGWYETALRYWCLKAGFDCVKGGRWQPRDPVLEVVLKEKRKPIPMYARRIESRMPTNGVPVGFDFLVGDLVEPDGKGESPDMLLTYSEAPETNTWERYDFTISFTNRCDGAYVRKKDSFSAFASDYVAPDIGYRSEWSYVYERTDDKIIQEKRLTEDEVLVFRVRSRIDEKGNVVEANYGKIYGEFDFAHGPKKSVIFSYTFNPTPNDRNLEFDGKTNLFRPGPYDDGWPREP